MKKITLKVIADILGVSQTMVSRALSDKYGVSEDMRVKIRLTALDLGYLPSDKIKKAKSNAITVVINRYDFNDNKFYLKLIESIEREINIKKMSLLLNIVDNGNDNIPHSIAYKKTDGIIVMGRITSAHFSKFLGFSVPMVLLDTPEYYNNVDIVYANNFYGAYEATNYIIKHGHKRIAFIGSPDFAFSFSERLRGYLACAEQYKSSGITAFHTTASYDGYEIPYSVEEAKKILSPANGITAVVCANDPVALLIYKIAAEMGLYVPQDISVIGFDDVPNTEQIQPKLTSVKIYKSELGKLALDILIKRINNPDLPYTYTQLSTDIVERESVIFNLR